MEFKDKADLTFLQIRTYVLKKTLSLDCEDKPENVVYVLGELKKLQNYIEDDIKERIML